MRQKQKNSKFAYFFAYKIILYAGINESAFFYTHLDVYAERNLFFGHKSEWNFRLSFNANALNNQTFAIIKTYFIANIYHSSVELH